VNDVALVTVANGSHERDSYEVVILQKDGKMPSDEQWGTHGFTYTGLDQARKKFKELVNLRSG
jgi:hypothetical protein